MICEFRVKNTENSETEICEKPYMADRAWTLIFQAHRGAHPFYLFGFVLDAISS